MPSAAMKSSVRFLKRRERWIGTSRDKARGQCWQSRGSGARPPVPEAPEQRRGARPYLDDALDVPVPLGEVHGAELGRALPVLHVGTEHGARAFPLPADDAAHGALTPASRGKKEGLMSRARRDPSGAVTSRGKGRSPAVPSDPPGHRESPGMGRAPGTDRGQLLRAGTDKRERPGILTGRVRRCEGREFGCGRAMQVSIFTAQRKTKATRAELSQFPQRDFTALKAAANKALPETFQCAFQWII
ncbi:uncharacterized protein LOC141728291 [Zonotrichia albicollis]|uniref:uncharacterized protein LOC141728291 n=1 Tax=Zonotrichia albicollis TaxID=44394 RepID=UPI003D80E8DD